MGFEMGTPVNMSTGPLPIERVGESDKPRMGSLGADGKLSWTDGTLAWRMGGEAAAEILYIAFGDVQVGCTPGQPFLMPDGSLKRADELLPGVDRLVEADGTQVTVSATRSAMAFEYSLALTGFYLGSVDGHLIEVQGVVCADAVLENRIGPDWAYEGSDPGSPV